MTIANIFVVAYNFKFENKLGKRRGSSQSVREKCEEKIKEKFKRLLVAVARPRKTLPATLEYFFLEKKGRIVIQ